MYCVLERKEKERKRGGKGIIKNKTKEDQVFESSYDEEEEVDLEVYIND